MEYRGYLVSVDSYMNIQLANTEEFIDGKLAGSLGEVLIRCNNILYIREVQEEGEVAAAPTLAGDNNWLFFIDILPTIDILSSSSSPW